MWFLYCIIYVYCLQGQLENVKELLSFMSEDQVEPNAQTYAAIFECVERSDLINKNLALHYYHSQMQEKVIN